MRTRNSMSSLLADETPKRLLNHVRSPPTGVPPLPSFALASWSRAAAIFFGCLRCGNVPVTRLTFPLSLAFSTAPPVDPGFAFSVLRRKRYSIGSAHPSERLLPARRIRSRSSGWT